MEINLENKKQIIALLRDGTCPICGKNGFVNPLAHVTKIHGIGKRELKDLLLLPHSNGFASPELAEKLSTYAKKQTSKEWINRYSGRHSEITKKKMHSKALADPKRPRTLKKATATAASKKKRAVVRMSEFGEEKEYTSLTEAAADNNAITANIHHCLTGKAKTCAGYKWKYKV